MRLPLVPLFVLSVFCLPSAAQNAPTNLDFEQGEIGTTPPGWFVPKSLREAGYNATLTRENCRTGACVMLTVPETRPPNTFANIMNSAPAAPYRGKRVVFRAAVRTEALDGGAAAMWFRVDLNAGGMGFFDNMSNRMIRSGEWTFYEIRAVVDAEARTINYGVMGQGNVRVWVDDASIETIESNQDPRDVSAAREEIGKLYARLDTAQMNGEFDAMKAVATPDAQVGSVMMKMPIEEGVARMKSELGGAGTKLTLKTEIESIDLSGDQAEVKTKSVMTLFRDGVSTTRKGTNTDTWVRVNGAWRLKEAVMVSSVEVMPPTDPETVKLVVAALKKRTVPLTGVEAGKPYEDLKEFGKAVGDARVVSLGEATHGTREIFQMKHRLLEYLVKEKGFTVFAIEANWPESLAADRYIKTGQGDPKAALADMYFWTWQTEEVLAMLEWMRAFNGAPGEHPTLSFTSFDMQTFAVARDRVLAFVKQHAPEQAASVEAAYSDLSKVNPRAMSDPKFEQAATKAESVTALMQTHREALTKATSPEAFRDALQMSRIAAQAARMRTPGAGSSYRDQMMAKNVEWLLNEAFPKEKIVLWAHNGHVTTMPSLGFKPMGNWLRESIGSQMYVLGFAINTGTVRAVTREGGRGIGLAESKLPAVSVGTGTAILSDAGQPLFFWDLRKNTGVLAKWANEPHLYRSFGAVWDRDNPESSMRSESLSKSYDGLIYMESTQAARGIKQ